MKSKSITFVSTMTAVPWGGSEELWGRTAFKLHKQGSKVQIVMPSVRVFPEFLSALNDVKIFANRKFKVLKKINQDLVLINHGVGNHGVPWMIYCKKNKIPYASLTQTSAFFGFPSAKQADVAAEAYEGALCNYFVAHENLEITRRLLGIPIENGVIVRNPFNVDFHSTKPWPNNNEVYKIACAARHQIIHKGQDLLLEVLSHEKWKNRPLEVTLTGKGPDTNLLEALIEKFELRNVQFSGHVGEINEIWSEHHACILPSRLEGLPLALVEAMLSGRFGIVTDVGGSKEVIRDNETGFVAKGPTVELIDEALERAWQSRLRWQDIAESAGTEIRGLVPSCPEEVFSEKLLGIA